MAEKSKELVLGYKFRSNRPYPHQLKALIKGLELNGATGLFMEPGTGKTRVTIDFIGIKHRQVGLNKVLVICPKIAIGVWQDQIFEYLPRAIKRNVLALDSSLGTIKDRIAVVKENKDVDCLTFMLVNYDVLADQTRIVDKKVAIREGMRETLRRWRPDMVVLDESHFIKNGASSRSRACHYIGNSARWRWALSGTPITNKPLDIFSQFKFLDSGIFGNRWASFRDRYSTHGGYGGFKLLRYNNLDEMEEKVGLISFKATKDEMDLPEKLPPQLIKIPMLPKTHKAYEKMEKTMILELKELGKKATAAIILTKLIRLRQITGGFVRVTEEDGSWEDVPLGMEKLEALKELLETYCIEGGYKVVIFAVFKWEIVAIKRLCDKIKLQAIVDVGKKEDRVKFRDDKSISAYIVPLSKGGIAVNELVAAHIGIFYSIDHSSDHIIQAMDRLHRPGQNHAVTYNFLALQGSLDVKMFKAFIENKNLADEIIYNIRRQLR